MPELLVALQRKESRRSKSPTSPPFQIRKVLPAATFSGVVSPWITPSPTLQRRGSPSQPSRSLPSKSCCMSAGSAGAVEATAAGASARATGMAFETMPLTRATTTATLTPGDDRRHGSAVMEASKKRWFSEHSFENTAGRGSGASNVIPTDGPVAANKAPGGPGPIARRALPAHRLQRTCNERPRPGS